MRKAKDAGRKFSGKVVMVATGNGLKDPDIVALPESERVRPTTEAVRALL